MKGRIMDDAEIEPAWLDYFSQGMQYRNTAERSLRRPDVFRPDIIYNIAAMAIEKILMSVFMIYGNLPLIHTLSAMGAAAKDILDFDDNLVSDMDRMDSMQMICYEESVCYGEMKDSDVRFFLDVMIRVFDKAETYINRHGRM